MRSIHVHFVCTGNICRSPTAEAVLRRLAQDRGKDGPLLHVASSGLAPHADVGEPPDVRAVAEARRRGIELGRLRASRFEPKTFETADFIFGMDRSHMRDLARLQGALKGSPRAALHLFTDFSEDMKGEDIDDPYYGGAEDFEIMFDRISAGCQDIWERFADAGRP